MYFNKEQIVAKISEISQEKSLHDNQLAQLQLIITNNKKYNVVELRKQFTKETQDINAIIRDNSAILDLLKYRSEKLAKQGVNLMTQLMRVQALKEYFIQLKEKLKREQVRGEEIIIGRERWELNSRLKEDGSPYQDAGDEHQSLINSNRTAQQTTQMARSVYENLSNQGGQLESVREKMGAVLQNINLAGNIAQLLRTRTREDNKLIIRLSLGLLVWTLFCLYGIRPYLKGY